MITVSQVTDARPPAAAWRWLLALLMLAESLVAATASRAERVRARVGDCVLEAPAELAGLVESLAREAGPLLSSIEQSLGSRARAPYVIVLLPRDVAADPDLARLAGAAPEWAGGFLLSEARIGAIRLGLADRYPYRGVRSVLVHEATHMLLFDATDGVAPRWFEEGVATWLERRWSWRDGVVLSTAMLTLELPELRELDTAFFSSEASARLAYAASLDFVAWAVSTYGEELLPEVLAAMPALDLETAFRQVTGESLADAEETWRRRRLWWARWLPLLTASGTLWAVMSMLVIVAFARKRRRTKRLLEQWELEEVGSLDLDLDRRHGGS